MIVEQYVPAYHVGDAIGNSLTAFHRFLVGTGIDARIIALTIDPGLEAMASLFSDYRPIPEAVKILHFAVPSPLSEFFRTVPGKRVLIYHNITPARFFVHFSADLVRLTEAGRTELLALSDVFDLCVADSTYNARELEELRFRNVHPFPILIDLDQYGEEPSRAYAQLVRDERKNILWVGRVTPNKRVEDLIKVLFFYKKYLNPSIRLIIAGNNRTLPRYFLACQDLASRFHLTSEDILFTGHIPFTELLALYRSADLFLSLSEHEGFCLPLIESCLFELPVLAYMAGAVPETLGGAGVLLHQKNVELAAGSAQEILEDAQLAGSLRQKARERIGRYRRESRPEGLLQWLREI